MAKAKAQCVQTFTGVRGSPMIGTCWGTDKECPSRCMDSDPPMMGPAKVALAPALRMIAARGPGRVMLRGKITLDEACADAERIDAKGDK